MKVLCISHHLKGNDGWSRYARNLIIAVQKEGEEVLCLVNEITDDITIPQKKCLSEPLKYVANPIISLRTALIVNEYIQEFSPDIVHFVVEPYATIIPFLKRRKAKIALSVHSTFAFMPILVSGFRHFVLNYTTRWMYAGTDLIIAVSEYTKQYLIRHMAGIKASLLVENKIVVSSGGIDLFKFILQREHNASPVSEILFVGAI